MTTISVTNPGAIALINNRANLTSIWQTPEWRKESAAYKTRHPAKCSRCGTVGPIVPGHSEEDYHPDMFESYLQKVRNDECAPLCLRCNRMESKGKHPCPDCVTKHNTDPAHRINYITQKEERCRQCEPDYSPEASKFRDEQGNRIRNRLNRKSYRAMHPGKKVVNGVWVSG